MEFLNKSNTALISSEVVVTEKIFNNETVYENILLGLFFIFLSMRSVFSDYYDIQLLPIIFQHVSNDDQELQNPSKYCQICQSQNISPISSFQWNVQTSHDRNLHNPNSDNLLC